MKLNPIIAVLGFLGGLGGALGAYFLSAFSASLATNASITLIASILGLIGIWLFNKDYKVAIAQYVIAAIGVLFGTSLFGVVGFIFYIIAAVVAYTEKDKSITTQTGNIEEHYFGNPQEIKQYPTKSSSNMALWVIPILTVVLIAFAGIAGQMFYNYDMHTKGEGITLTNLSSDIKTSYGITSGSIKGRFTSDNDISSVRIKAVFYDSSGAQIDEAYDSNILGNVNAGQSYELNIPYSSSSDSKPARAEIRISESFDDEILYAQNVTF
ncbi:MAG: hypothetical protein BZ136_01020 [Methanosphaera sp. rholeuAM74]|nr:MAG: hypothetical protein BZ136_01020 [Methanosphaera sp. rholeuAM74]